MEDQPSILRVGELELDPDGRKFFVNGAKIFLRNKEFTLMQYFMLNAGKVLTRTEILEEVWDRNIFCPTNTVDVHVGKLRKKIGEYLRDHRIRTVHCIGYIFDY